MIHILFCSKAEQINCRHSSIRVSTISVCLHIYQCIYLPRCIVAWQQKNKKNSVAIALLIDEILFAQCKFPHNFNFLFSGHDIFLKFALLDRFLKKFKSIKIQTNAKAIGSVKATVWSGNSNTSLGRYLGTHDFNSDVKYAENVTNNT